MKLRIILLLAAALSIFTPKFFKSEAKATPIDPGLGVQTLQKLGAIPTQIINEILGILSENEEFYSNDNLSLPLHTKIGQHEIQILHGEGPDDDYLAIIHIYDGDLSTRKTYEVEWSGDKTGKFPGPEKAIVRAFIKGKKYLQNYWFTMEEKINDGKKTFDSQLHFSLLDLASRPIERGLVDIFEDVERGTKKISASIIQGPTDILPEAMIKKNLQAIVDQNGTIYFRQDESAPIREPLNQQHFCKSPSGNWIAQESPQWQTSCDTLFDKSYWHGFTFTTLPNSYEPFLKESIQISVDTH